MTVTTEERLLMSLEEEAKTEASELELLAALVTTQRDAIQDLAVERGDFRKSFQLGGTQTTIAAALQRRARAWREQSKTLGEMRRRLRRQRLAESRRAWQARRLEAIAN